MKQFQIKYENDEYLYKKLKEIEQWCDTNPSYTVVFRIYSNDMNPEHITHICDILDEKMPDAMYLGSTSNANIVNGEFTKTNIILTCTIFEYETTQVKVMQFPFSEDNAKEYAHRLKEYCDANPWVNTVEIHSTMLGMSIKEFCDEMSTLRSDIQVFGGGACNPDITLIGNAVFSKGNSFSEHGIVFLLLGGSDLHTYSTFICGWQPLKRRFKVTKANGNIMGELDGEPAFNLYHRFLNIDNNDQFVKNSIEFPFSVSDDDVDILRCPIAVNDDNSIVMTGEIAQGSEVSFSFGDPETILKSIRHDGQKIAEFQPEAIQIFSCAARKWFWSDENISNETILFNSIAPTSGFYTSGELLRVNGVVHAFNSTLIFAAMREGEPKNNEIVQIYDADLESIESERITLIRRFISFIEATTAEFEALNRKLAVISITDGLTNLYNRSEIEKRIRSMVEKRRKDETENNLALIMLDIDDFKLVNDLYGHQEGDRVIIALSEILRKTMRDVPSSIGRWGGEEFMVLLPYSDMNKAAELAERICMEFSAVSFENAGCQTVSIGVIQAKDDEAADMLYSRVDKALYMAKEQGKNQVVKLN